MAEVPDFPIDIIRGDDYSIEVTWTGGDGNLVNLTGYAIVFRVRAENDDASFLYVDSSTTNGQVVIAVDPTTGVFTAKASGVITKALPKKGTLRYSIRATSPTADTILKGPVNLHDVVQ